MSERGSGKRESVLQRRVLDELAKEYGHKSWRAFVLDWTTTESLEFGVSTIKRAVSLALCLQRKEFEKEVELIYKLIKKIEKDRPLFDSEALKKLDTLIKLQRAILKVKNMEEINDGKK